MVRLKHLCNFWRALELSLINCTISLTLTWPIKCVLCNDIKATTYVIIGTKRYVPVVTSSTKDSAKLLQQLKLGFNRTINRNKYQSRVTRKTPKPYLDYSIDPGFQGGNRSFVFYCLKML